MKRILIVDDHEVVRNGVKRAFDVQPGPITFGDASTGQEAVRLVRDQDWDVIVLDISLGGRSGLEVLKELKELRPRLPVLILSMHSQEHFVRRALKAGAAGYITKDSPRADIVKAVDKVVSGGRYVSAAIAERLIFFDLESNHPALEMLSDREFEVLRLIASGKTIGEIGDILSLSNSTISTYRARIMDKMKMKTNAELTRYAIKNKLVD